MDGEGAVRVLDRLCAEYGVGPKEDADMYGGLTPFQILISTVLSQQTTERNCRKASERLFSKYPDALSLASAEQSEVEGLVFSSGHYRMKAKAVLAISKILAERYGGEVPNDMEALLALPMVGRKTASCVMRYAFGTPSVIVDTHINRVSVRLGLSPSGRPGETENAIRGKVPPERWDDLDICFMTLGRNTCTARCASCDSCPVNGLCEKHL